MDIKVVAKLTLILVSIIELFIDSNRFLEFLPHALTHGLFFGWFEGPLTVV